MAETLEGLEERLDALDGRGEETTEKVDVLVGIAVALGSNDPARTLAVCRAAYELSGRLGYLRGTAYSLGYMGFAHHLLSDHEAAYARLQEALPLLEELGDRDGQALAWSELAGVQLSLGNYEQSLSNGIKALKLFRETGNRLQEAWTLNGFGTGYTDFGAYDRALAFFEDARRIFEEVGERVGAARALSGIGTVYHRRGDYEKALPYHRESLAVFEETGNRIGEARALNDLGVVYHHLGDDDTAIDYHRKSLRIREEVGNRQAQSTSLIQLGTLYLRRGEVEPALEALHRALAIAEDVKARPRIYQAHRGLAEAYERQGRLADALHHYKAYHRVREAVLGEATQAKINNVQVRFDVEKAEQTAEIERLRNVELREKNEALHRVLQELKATQAQLIQQEKMASLGELTAGIAHEIKNPLNFVTNFSQLSGELTEEIVDALQAHRDRPVAEVLDDVQDLLRDLRFNVEKIQEHGRRADDIVRSMLLHSRGKPGERRPTDLNALLDEYVNLAYHGMRARHADFNVTLERVYDEAVGAVEVVPHEIGRVLLNLLNNAFYAVHQKAASGDEAYAPTVWVRSQRLGRRVEIRIRDNGPGVPPALRTRIFEPFFTTKPTGTGTGLGLSLSYDIVTQGHRGTLRFESDDGEGATFIVTLPGAEA